MVEFVYDHSSCRSLVPKRVRTVRFARVIFLFVYIASTTSRPWLSICCTYASHGKFHITTVCRTSESRSPLPSFGRRPSAWDIFPARAQIAYRLRCGASGLSMNQPFPCISATVRRLFVLRIRTLLLQWTFLLLETALW